MQSNFCAQQTFLRHFLGERPKARCWALEGDPENEQGQPSLRTDETANSFNPHGARMTRFCRLRPSNLERTSSSLPSPPCAPLPHPQCQDGAGGGRRKKRGRRRERNRSGSRGLAGFQDEADYATIDLDCYQK